MLKGEKMNPIPKGERETLWCRGCEQELSTSRFGKEGFTSAGTQKYRSRCKPCFKKYKTSQYGDERKTILVDERKIKCENCGYDKYSGALEFHHLDKNTKLFEVSAAMYKVSILYEDFVEEVNKCVVLCCNCHREVHFNNLDLSKFVKHKQK